MDGIQFDVNVEAGSSLDNVRTNIAVYQHPELTATLLTTEFDETFANSLGENSTALEIVECYAEGRLQWWLQIRELQITEFSLICPKITKMANKGISKIPLFDIKLIQI